jgi:hypothetical protein
MRKIALLFVLGIIIALPVQKLHAQPVKSNVVKTNLFSPIIRTGHLLYERVLNEDMSAQLGFFYTGFTIAETTQLRGFGITPEFRYYLSNKAAPAGIYAAISPRYNSFTLKNENENAEATWSAFGAALNIGAQALLKDVVTLEAYLGPAYSAGSLDVTVGNEDDFDIGSLDGFGIRFGITVGVAF